MLTLADYLADPETGKNRSETHASEYSAEIEGNAAELIAKVNMMLDILELPGVKITSGWRPQSVNDATPRAAKKSSHISGQGIDIQDRFRYLAKLLLRQHDVLERCGLWMEDPVDAKDHVHLQSVPFPSWKPGMKRIYRA